MNLGNTKRKVYIDGKKLKNTNETKFLGLLIDKKMTLKNHIQNNINSTFHLVKFFNLLKIKYKIPKKINLSLSTKP